MRGVVIGDLMAAQRFNMASTYKEPEIKVKMEPFLQQVYSEKFTVQ